MTEEEIKPIPELEAMKKLWYNTDAIAFEMIHSMKYKESVFIAVNRKATQRMLKINAVRYLYMNFERYKFFDEEYLYNIYHSVAHFPMLPMTSWKYEEKREEQAKFNANFMDYIKGYDLFIDLDNTNHELVYASTTRLKKIFDHFKIIYNLTYCISGDMPVLTNKGFMKIKDCYKDKDIKEVLSMVDGSPQFKSISKKIKTKGILYDIFHEQSGVPLQISEGHSVRILDDNMNISSINTEDLKKGDYLITYNDSEIERPKRTHIDVSYIFKNKEYERRLKLTDDLLLVCGYYLGDGYMAKSSNQITIGMGAHKKRRISKLIKSLKKIPNHNDNKICLYENSPHQTVSTIHTSNPILKTFLLDNFGKLAHHKKLPDWIFDLGKEQVLKLLEGYINTDGHIGKYTISIKSVSHSLIMSFIWLLKLKGINCGIYEEKMKHHILPQGTYFKGSHVYILKIPKDKFYNIKQNKFAPSTRDVLLPTKKLKEVYLNTVPSEVKTHRATYGTIRKKRANHKKINEMIHWICSKYKKKPSKKDMDIISKYKSLMDTRMGFLKIRKIIKKRRTDVYCFTVPDTESFFAGAYPILCKNSGSKGFHICVPFENLPQKLKQLPFDKLAKLFKLFAYELKLIKKIKDIDTSIFDLRRIKKVPYSVVYPYYRVALPLTDEQFDNFNLDDVFLPNLIDDAEKMQKRGLLTREGIPERLLLLMRELANKRKKSSNLFKICKFRKQTLYGFMEEVGLNE